VEDALKHLQTEDCSSRLGFIHASNPAGDLRTSLGSSMITHQAVAMSAFRTVSPEEVLELIEHLNEDDASFASRSNGPQTPLDQMRQAGVQSLALKGWGLDQETRNPYDAWAEAGSEIIRKLGIDGTKPHLIVNGRVSRGYVRPLKDSSSDHSRLLLSPTRTSLLSKRTSTASVPSQSWTCSKQCTMI